MGGMEASRHVLAKVGPHDPGHTHTHMARAGRNTTCESASPTPNRRACSKRPRAQHLGGDAPIQFGRGPCTPKGHAAPSKGRDRPQKGSEPHLQHSRSQRRRPAHPAALTCILDNAWATCESVKPHHVDCCILASSAHMILRRQKLHAQTKLLNGRTANKTRPTGSCKTFPRLERGPDRRCGVHPRPPQKTTNMKEAAEQRGVQKKYDRPRAISQAPCSGGASAASGHEGDIIAGVALSTVHQR